MVLEENICLKRHINNRNKQKLISYQQGMKPKIKKKLKTSKNSNKESLIKIKPY